MITSQIPLSTRDHFLLLHPHIPSLTPCNITQPPWQAFSQAMAGTWCCALIALRGLLLGEIKSRTENAESFGTPHSRWLSQFGLQTSPSAHRSSGSLLPFPLFPKTQLQGSSVAQQQRRERGSVPNPCRR